MALDLRCPAKLHGRMVEDHSLEVKCDSRFCGAGRGVVVFHVIDVLEGKIIKTTKFQDPIKKARPA
jgi:hypothetical protein